MLVKRALCMWMGEKEKERGGFPYSVLCRLFIADCGGWVKVGSKKDSFNLRARLVMES